MSVFYIAARGIKNISIEDIDKRWVTFTYKEMAILELFGVKFVRYEIKSGGNIGIAHNGKISTQGRLYAPDIYVGSTVLIRDMNTLDMASWGLGAVNKFLLDGKTIHGLTIARGGVLSCSLESDNRESTFMTLCTGARGYIHNGRLLRFRLSGAVFTPGDYCSEILYHSIITSYEDVYTIYFDRRIKVLEGGWLNKVSHSTTVICDLREEMPDTILDVLLHSNVEMAGYDLDYTSYANCIFTFKPMAHYPSMLVEQRFLSRYKDELLRGIEEADLDGRWFDYYTGRNSAGSSNITTLRDKAYARMKKALSSNKLTGVSVTDLSMAFQIPPAATMYVGFYGRDKDILDAFRYKITHMEGSYV